MSDEGDVVSDGGSGVYDVLVVGSGIMGSWTAYMLAEKGVKTLLLEQVMESRACLLLNFHLNVLPYSP